MKKKTKKTKVRPRKQSSPKASTIAAKWLKYNWPFSTIRVPTMDLKTLCASVLSQDETKGQK